MATCHCNTYCGHTHKNGYTYVKSEPGPTGWKIIDNSSTYGVTATTSSTITLAGTLTAAGTGNITTYNFNQGGVVRFVNTPDPKVIGESIRIITNYNTYIQEPGKATNEHEINGLTPEKCLEIYERHCKMSESPDWLFTFAKDTSGRRIISIKPWKDDSENKGLIMLLHETCTLDADQLETAQKEWSKKVKSKMAESDKKSMNTIVVDNSIPGESDE
jgi:hypothetical protein